VIHQVKKLKVKLVENKDKKNKTNPPEAENERNDEKKTTNRKGKGPGSSKKQPTSIENEDTPINDELKLSEDDEPTDEKSKGATAKKGPTKRTAPASGKKTGVTSAKKKGQNEEPFDDRTNDEVENNTEDDPSAAKQSKKRSFS